MRQKFSLGPYLRNRQAGCDKRTPDLVQAFERNTEMRTIVKSVLTDEDATDKRKCFRKLATTRRKISFVCREVVTNALSRRFSFDRC